MVDAQKIRGWLILTLILLASLTFASSAYIPKHSIYNDGPEGTSSLRSDLTDRFNINVSRLLVSPFGLTGESDVDFMVVIGSERTYQPSEVAAYREFVEDGGTLIIFEDFGPARDIAASMGITYLGGMLRERREEITINRPSQLFVRDLAASTLTGGEYQLFLLVSEASAIIDIQGLSQGTTIPLAVTFESAFMDIDNDNQVDSSDLSSPAGFPIALLKNVGNGTLAVISDASIPLNQYWNRQVDLQGQVYNLPNAFWTTLLITTLYNVANASSIVFDESHQQFLINSFSGTFNLVLGTWIGLLNSATSIFYLFIFIVSFIVISNRQYLSDQVSKLRAKDQDETDGKFVSNPNLAERSLSEQYLLFRKWGKGFLQIANSELYSLIKQTNRAEAFLELLENEYGDINQKRSFDELMEIHIFMRDYVDRELKKWL